MKSFSKSLVIAGVLSLGLTVSAPSAHAAESKSACHAIVNQLVSEWKNFDSSKTSQTVQSTNLQTKGTKQATPQEIAYMKGQVQQAQADCNAGYQQTALDRANSVHAMLDERGGISPEVANAAVAPSK